MAKTTHEFQAETKELLNLMIHSIYTNHEIFLRELISNASDAIDKLHFASLQNRDILEGNEDYEIFLVPDKDSHTLTISDNGLGMTKEEVIENLGTIAKPLECRRCPQTFQAFCPYSECRRDWSVWCRLLFCFHGSRKGYCCYPQGW